MEKSIRSLWRSRLRDSARGFSLWDDDAPLIAVNSAWNPAARVYTLFHEYGHLLSRTSSVCLERVGVKISRPTDPAERWCKEFAAAALLPWSGVSKVLKDRFEWSKRYGDARHWAGSPSWRSGSSAPARLGCSGRTGSTRWSRSSRCTPWAF